MPTPFANDRSTNIAVVLLAFLACAGIITGACFWLAHVTREVWEIWPWR